MDIYDILTSVKYNRHHLHRYMTFLQRCQQINEDDMETKYHLHHICPKAVFPQYKNLKRHIWNGIHLTPRQHFIAHLILAKAIPHVSTCRAVIYMSGRVDYGSSRIVNSKLYEKLLTEFVPYERTKEIRTKLSNSTKHLVAAYDTTSGTNVRVTKDEFQTNDNLVGIVKFKNVNSYRRMKEDHSENMSKAQKLSKENKVQCPHCMKLSDISNYKRWHGDNCSSLPENKQTTVYHEQRNERQFVKVKDLETYFNMGYVIRSVKAK